MMIVINKMHIVRNIRLMTSCCGIRQIASCGGSLHSGYKFLSSAVPSGREVDPYPTGHPDKETIVVYGRPTTRVEKVLFMLEELCLPYTRVHFESPPPAYIVDINPTKLVPAIRDGPVTIHGSNSICVYLAHKHGQQNGMFPSCSIALGLAFQWSEYTEGYLATPRLNHVYHACVNKAYPPSLAKPGCPSDKETEDNINATAAALRILDDHIARAELQQQPFIALTTTLTFADAVAAPWLHKWYVHAEEYGPKLSREQFPAVSRYYERLSARASFHRGILYRAST